MSDAHESKDVYDVVVIGGRPAGASLAARLGAKRMRVLIVDRASFPSAPAVPSCPVLYPAAMALLDEMGVDEASFAAGSSRLDSLTLEVRDLFRARFAMLPSHGRQHLYSLDRVSFDLSLWQHLARYPSVVARSGVSFVDLLRDGAGRVCGAVLREGDGAPLQVRAGVVVGADGRFSAVARKAGAKVTEDVDGHTSTLYFADWEGVSLSEDGSRSAACVHVTGRGLDILHFPTAQGRTLIATHHRSDRARIDGDAGGYYEGLLRAQPVVWRRLEGARRVTPVVGLKRVGNRYLETSGPGWALVGDAAHHKDPVDGQGIYDALFGSKVLAEVLGDVHAGAVSFDEGMSRYRALFLAETHGMFAASMDRLKRELYAEPPAIVMRTLMRWLLTDQAYGRQFLRFLNRDIPPEGWLNPSLVLGALGRGALGDIRQLLGRPGADAREKSPSRG